MSTDTLRLSEHFLSIQGEGKTIGTPAIFWRFGGCPFTCKWCDTIEVWKKWTAYNYEELYDLFNNAGYFARMNHHTHHLVITGGDPLLQQFNIAAFLAFCADRGEQVDNWYIECENQGFIPPAKEFSEYVSLWNISPKLSNSGIAEERRIISANIDFYVNRCQAIFKFPVANKEDILEVIAFQRRFSIQSGRIWLMPVCSTRTEHETAGRLVAEMAKQYGLKFSPRLQLVLWDRANGV